MKQIHLKCFCLAIMLTITFNFSIAQQNRGFWKTNNDNFAKTEVIFYKNTPKVSKTLDLNFNALTNNLTKVVNRTHAKVSKTIINFPNPNGELEPFMVFEASVMEAELQAKFPEIKSYVGKSLKNPSSTIRFSVSPYKGLSATILSNNKTVFIEPYTKDLNTYIVFSNSKHDVEDNNFICEVENLDRSAQVNDIDVDIVKKNADDGKLRTYRLALACTGEYATFHGGTKSQVLAAMNTTMTRVNAVFERDMALTMVLIDNNEDIIYLDANTDPYTNNNGSTMLGENQTTLDNVIGTDNYDIGHVFSTGGGGVAYLNSPCSPDSKAGGVTGQGAPVGDTFDIDYVAHEMGHQYGANHTQNNSCQRSNVSVEPGSASTIMGYAGICSPNVQSNSDDYFHGENIKEMWANISGGTSSTCATESNTGNTAPTANAGADYSIPKSTPFILKGSGSDADTNNTLTYCWEQIDAEVAQMPPTSTSTVGPAFRSLLPKTSPNRYMPDFSTVLAGNTQTTWEVLPSVARQLNFLLTVRDNALNGGSTASDTMVINVTDSQAFTVVTPPTWAQNTQQTLTWTVGETNQAPINCQAVNILLSTDNGATYTTLASNTANDGEEIITMPNIADTENAFILIEAIDNIFYNVTNKFKISSTPDFEIANTSGDLTVCNEDTLTYNLTYAVSNGFSDTVTLSANTSSGATVNFTPATISNNGDIVMEVSNLNTVAAGDYTIAITGTSASLTKTLNVNFSKTTGVCESVANTQFQTSTTLVKFNTINNASAKPSGYSDYKNIVTDVTIGNDYELTVNVNTDGDWNCKTLAWIDWNQNCTFDTNETYDLGEAQNVTNDPTSNSPLTITVPEDAVEGITIMRVTTKYDTLPNACENGHDAEVEDYSINVSRTLSADDSAINSFQIYPNPNNGNFIIESKFALDNTKMIVRDVQGREVYKNFYNTFIREEINLNKMASGVYFIKLNNNLNTVTKKIIIE